MRLITLRRTVANFALLTATLVLTFPTCITFASDKPPIHADLIVLNANVLTVERANPHAQAFAVAQGRFLAVGSNDQIRPLADAKTQILDLAGRTVTPGFVDAHLHPHPLYPEGSLYAIVELGPKRVHSLAELIVALKKKAQITPKGQWIIGSGYQDTKLGRHPTRADLDRASTDHPIQIEHSSGHISVVNSVALQNAHITKATPDPKGGKFDRDAEGEPNGVCRESAADPVLNAGPKPLRPSRAEEVQGMLRCMKGFVARGLTSVADAGASPESFRLYQEARSAGNLVRINVMLMEEYLPLFKSIGIQSVYGDDSLRIGTIKVFHGNSLSGRTCWLKEPYADRPNYYGIPPARTQEQLNELILNIHRNGLQAAVHSNGDREIEMVLTAFENAQRLFPRQNTRHRIEHCSVASQAILERAKKLGLVLVFHSYIYEHGDKMEGYGATRWGMMHPSGTALKMGIHVAGHSDWPVSDFDPLLRMQDLVCRRSAEGKVYGAEQRISLEQALEVFTIGSAYASFEEGTKGSIVVGKLADFVVLSADPRRVSSEAIKDIRVERTYIGGRQAYP